MSWRETRDYLERAHLAKRRGEVIPMTPKAMQDVEETQQLASLISGAFKFDIAAERKLLEYTAASLHAKGWL